MKYYTKNMSPFAVILSLAVCFPAVSADRSAYIFNGTDVDHAGKYPWQISLQTPSGWHFCGASLISKDWVLTARHCTTSGPEYQTSKDVSKIKVVVGLHDKYTKREGNPVTHEVAEIINHPRCGGRLSCDLTLLRLASPVKCNRYTKKIQLPDKDETFDGSDCVVTGWGTMKNVDTDRRVRVNVLQEMPVDVYSKSKCKRYWNYESVICIMNKKGPYGGVRPGDSGGPLSCKKNGVWKVAGAASFIHGSWGGAPNYPNAYAAASIHRDWIREKTGL